LIKVQPWMEGLTEPDAELRERLLRDFAPLLRFPVPLQSYLTRAPTARFLVDQQLRWVVVRALPNPSWSVFVPPAFVQREVIGQLVQALLEHVEASAFVRFGGIEKELQEEIVAEMERRRFALRYCGVWDTYVLRELAAAPLDNNPDGARCGAIDPAHAAMIDREVDWVSALLTARSLTSLTVGASF
jgi:hypothetical protein